MKFIIDTNNVILSQIDQVESGEYNVTECEFSFSEEYEGLTQKAIFTGEDGIAYLQTIIDNKCTIPSEILQLSQKVEIGVYGYSVENEELKLRYSPKPTKFYIHQGSYKEAQNSTPPTPSEIEQLQAQITTNANDIDTVESNIENIQDDITDIKAEQTEQNTNIQNNTDNINTLQNTKADKNEIPTKTSELVNDSDFVVDNNYIHTDNNFTNADKTQITTNKDNITTMQRDISNINSAVSDINKDIDNLEDNKANKNEIPTSTSDITNDSGFITKNVADLTNYYKKNETYTQQEIDTKISSVYRYKGTVSTYEDLPSTDLTTGDVYNVESDGSNYAWTGTTWDKLGGDIDLSDYYTKTQTDSLLSSKQNSITSSNKLASDLIDDTNQTNKFVTSAEKTQIVTNTTNIALKENLSNKVTSLSSSSTDTQYPSAKCVYDLVGDIETILTTLDVRKRGVVYEYSK